MSKNIDLKFDAKSFNQVLLWGANPDAAPYDHSEIAHWCESFWNLYCDKDNPAEIEKLMPILADVETQWVLWVISNKSASIPVAWFREWLNAVSELQVT